MLKVVAFGDSLTVGLDPAEGKDYPYTEFLGEKLKGKVKFINRGVNGDLTSGMLLRVQKDVLDLEPDYAIILGGANDIGWEVPPSRIVKNLEAMYQLCQEKGIVPVACAIPPLMYFDHLNTHRKEVNEKLATIAKQRGMPFVDFYTSLADPATGSLLAKYSSDGLHLKREGYHEMGRVLHEDLFIKGGLLPGKEPK